MLHRPQHIQLFWPHQAWSIEGFIIVIKNMTKRVIPHGKIAPYCLLGQPITTQDLIYLAHSQSKHYYENVHCKETILRRHLYFLWTWTAWNCQITQIWEALRLKTTLNVHFKQFIVIFITILFSWTNVSKGKGETRLTLCIDKSTLQHWELPATLFSI